MIVFRLLAILVLAMVLGFYTPAAAGPEGARCDSGRGLFCQNPAQLQVWWKAYREVRRGSHAVPIR